MGSWITSVYPCCGILLSIKNKLLIQCNILHESLDNYVEQKMPILKGYILHGSMYVTFLKWQNYYYYRKIIKIINNTGKN